MILPLCSVMKWASNLYGFPADFIEQLEITLIIVYFTLLKPTKKILITYIYRLCPKANYFIENSRKFLY